MALTAGKADIIEPGTAPGFIDATTQRRDTPTERVRREILKSFVCEYGYGKDQIEVGHPIKFGSGRFATSASSSCSPQ